MVGPGTRLVQPDMQSEEPPLMSLGTTGAEQPSKKKRKDRKCCHSASKAETLVLAGQCSPMDTHVFATGQMAAQYYMSARPSWGQYYGYTWEFPAGSRRPNSKHQALRDWQCWDHLVPQLGW